MYYGNRKEAGTNLAHALTALSTGWRLWGYTPDRSDWTTDYFAPAHWDGIATRETLAGLAVLAFDVDHHTAAKAGKPEPMQRPGKPLACPRCHGAGDGRDPELGHWTLEEARANPDAYHRAELLAEHPNAVPMICNPFKGAAAVLPPSDGVVATVRVGLLGVVSPIPFRSPGNRRSCIRCFGHGTIAGPTEHYFGDTWPAFEASPRGVAWVLTVAGNRVGSGRGIERLYRAGSAGAAALAAEIDALADAAAAPRPTTARQSGAVLAAGDVTITANAEKGGIEVRFPSKPAAEVLEALKREGWRWSRFSACWYTKDTPEAREFAARLAGAKEAAA